MYAPKKYSSKRIEVVKVALSTSSVKDETDLKKFFDELENLFENIEREYGEALWKKYLREPSGDLNEIECRRSEIILNDQYFNVIKEWKPKARNPVLAKRLRGLERILLRERIEALPPIFSVRNKINEKHIAFKPVVSGRQMDRTDNQSFLSWRFQGMEEPDL